MDKTMIPKSALICAGILVAVSCCRLVLAGASDERASVIESVTGSAEIVSPYRATLKASPGDILVAGERLITGDLSEVKILLPLAARLELGMDSILEISLPSRKKPELLLVKGRVRAKVKAGELIVKTPTAEVLASVGLSDIIISNFNTLAAPREGARLVVASVKARKPVPVKSYALVTAEGDLVISRN